MKTYTKDFAIDSSQLVNFGGDLENVINIRQEKFADTVTYQKASIKGMVNELESVLPPKKLGELKDAISNLECVLYSTAYREGMIDLMTTMTLNNLQITKAEYLGECEND